MTIYVTRAKKRGKGMLKPEAVQYPFDTGDNLHWLISQNPDAIYYTDNERAFFGPLVTVIEQTAVTYDVWVHDTLDPESMPVTHVEDVGGASVAANWAKGFNEDEAYRGRYHYFPVKVTTTKKFEEIR